MLETTVLTAFHIGVSISIQMELIKWLKYFYLAEIMNLRSYNDKISRFIFLTARKQYVRKNSVNWFPHTGHDFKSDEVNYVV